MTHVLEHGRQRGVRGDEGERDDHNEKRRSGP